MTVNALMSEANAELGRARLDPWTDLRSGPTRRRLKNALDKGNNNQNFVQATACPFSFAPLP
jgi:hypothetical protein